MARLTKSEDLEALTFYTRCRKLAAKKGYPADVYEDFPAWAFARVKDGAKGTASQLLIDYLRVTYGVTGTEGQMRRKAVNTASCNTVAYEELTASEASCPETALASEELWALAEGEDRAILMLQYKYGLTKREVGELYGVTEARISQRTKALLERLKGRLETG